MSYIDHNPRVAWAMAFESGIRTQAMANLIESASEPGILKSKRRKKYHDVAEDEKTGEDVVLTYSRDQVSAKQDKSRRGGAGAAHGDHYTSVYSVIRRMEQDQPVLAAVGHWLCLADTGEANQYLDDVADTVLARFIVATPEWGTYRKARKERIEALVHARMVMDRNDMDGSRPLWQPLQVCEFVNDWLGVKIISYNWQRDCWEQVWAQLGGIVSELEGEAMAPVAKVAREVNRAMREDVKDAA